MELRHLAAFVAVSETLHFGRAAERLGVAQPAVSNLVARLERELGLVLFDRTSHRVALTPDASALLFEARAALAAAKRLQDEAAARVAGRSGSVRLATTTGLGPRLAASLRRFTTLHPGVHIELSVLPTQRRATAVIDGTVDVALFRSGLDLPAGLNSSVVGSAAFVAVVPAGHPSAAAEPLVPRTLAELPMIALHPAENQPMAETLRRVCEAMEVIPVVGPRFTTPQEVLATISTGAGWALFVEDGAPAEQPGIAIRALPTMAPGSEVRAAWRTTGASRWAFPLVEVLCDTMGGAG